MPDVDPNLQTIVTSGLQAGKKRNDIVGELYNALGPDGNLSQAFSLYNELSKSSGLLLDKEGREKLLVEIVTNNTVDGKLNRDAAVNAYVERGRLAKGTAIAHVRDYCANNGIAFPIASRVKRDMDAVKAAVQAWHNEGVDRASILAGLKQHYQYTDNTAADAYRSIGKELGFLEGRSSENREAIARWFKENGTGERKDIIKALSDNFKMTENTASGYYSMFLFANTYCNLK